MISIWNKNSWCVCSWITFPSGSLWRRRLSRSSPFYLGRPPPWDNWFKCHQTSSNVINVIIMFLSTFWDDFPHTFLKSKPYSPCLDEVPGMLLQVVQLLHRLLQCQVLVHPVIIILINIIRWSFSFKHHNDFSGSGRPFSIGWYHAPYPIDCYADFWCFSWLTWWWFSDVAKTDGLPKWRLNIQDDPRWWKIV